MWINTRMSIYVEYIGNTMHTEYREGGRRVVSFASDIENSFDCLFCQINKAKVCVKKIKNVPV